MSDLQQLETAINQLQQRVNALEQSQGSVLADGIVSTPKIVDGAVTSEKQAVVPDLVPGTYNHPRVTVDSRGRVTAIESTYEVGSLLLAIGMNTANVVRVDEYKHSGLWQKPNSGSLVLIQLWGSGGSGSRHSDARFSLGGFGGDYVWALYNITDLPDNVTVAIGEGGRSVTGTATGMSGHVPGIMGKPSSFGDLMVAQGGFGGNLFCYNNYLSPYTLTPLPTRLAGETTRISRPLGVQSWPSVIETSGFEEGGGVRAWFENWLDPIEDRRIDVEKTVGPQNRVHAGTGGGAPYVRAAYYDDPAVDLRTPNTSIWGGRGGFGALSSTVSGSNGAQPGGGGGASQVASGKGGDGMCIVTVF